MNDMSFKTYYQLKVMGRLNHLDSLKINPTEPLIKLRKIKNKDGGGGEDLANQTFITIPLFPSLTEMRLRVSKCFNAIITSSTGTNKGKTFRIPSSQTLIMKIAVLAESLLTNKMVKLQPGVIENFP